MLEVNPVIWARRKDRSYPRKARVSLKADERSMPTLEVSLRLVEDPRKSVGKRVLWGGSSQLGFVRDVGTTGARIRPLKNLRAAADQDAACDADSIALLQVGEPLRSLRTTLRPLAVGQRQVTAAACFSSAHLEKPRPVSLWVVRNSIARFGFGAPGPTVFQRKLDVKLRD
jgi:hypothetical protein